MTDDIVARLREFNEERLNCEPWTCEQTAKEAADKIERLRAELDAANKRSLENYERWARDGEEAEARECALRCKLAAMKTLAYDRLLQVEAAEAERDARSALLLEAYPHIWPGDRALADNLRARIYAALKGDDRD